MMLEDLRRDVPYALRTLARAPGFTAVTVLTLALGIGANTAIFSVVNAVLLKPLSYAYDPDRLVRLIAHLPDLQSPDAAPRRVTVGFTAAEAADLRARTKTLSRVATIGPTLMSLTGHEDAARLQGAVVSASVFPILGRQPLLGRAILESDERPGQPDVILLSHSAWRRYFGGDEAIVGRIVTLETVLGPRRQRRCSIIGVMPPEFTFPSSQTQFWMPAVVSTSRPGPAFRGQMLGRLADGVTRQAAAAELAPIVRAIRQHGPDVRYELVREQDEIGAPVRPALLVLTGAVGFVLLIACVNVANLLLARSSARAHEIAVRAALGAGRRRLAQQALTESLMLAGLAGTAGVALAWGAVRLLRTLASTLARMDLGSSAGFPRLEEVGLDPVVLAFTVATTVAAGVLFGLAPAIRQFASEPIHALKNARSATASGSPPSAFQSSLAVAQIGMAMIVLVGALLLIRSFVNLASVEPGYQADHVLTFQVSLPLGRYPDDRLRSFAETLVDRLRSMPGVRAAAYANQLPFVQLRDTLGLSRTPGGRTPPGAGGVDARFVSRDYFAVMGIRVLDGRGFRESDREGQQRVLLVNEAVVRRDFHGKSPVGLSVYMGGEPVPWEIVGVVADVRQFTLDREAQPQFFADLRQWTGGVPLFPIGAYYAVRTDGDPSAIVPAVRETIRALDSQAALFNVAGMDALVAGSIARPRLYAVLMGIFAGVGVVIALIGIYGVMAFLVAQRTQEIGIRLALGASPPVILALVLRRGLALTVAGTLAGVAGGLVLTRFLEGLLFGITPLDAGVFAFASLSLAVVAIAASFVPARRATRVDPLAAIRCE